MIADTSIWIDFFRGKTGVDLDLFRLSLNEGRVLMAPAVLAELLGSTEMTESVEKALSDMEFAKPSTSYPRPRNQEIWLQDWINASLNLFNLCRANGSQAPEVNLCRQLYSPL